jgi:hypothetical protein
MKHTLPINMNTLEYSNNMLGISKIVHRENGMIAKN